MLSKSSDRAALLWAGVSTARSSRIPNFIRSGPRPKKLGVLIFIHPQGTGELSISGRLKGNGVLENVIGNSLEMTIALSHLIFEGTLDTYPGLKICAAHAGGYLPLLCRPLGSRLRDFPPAMHQDAQQEADRIPEAALLRLARLHPRGVAPPDRRGRQGQIVMGTDYPFPWTKTAVDHILTTPGLSV